jgi:hypothetical protein
MPHHHVPLTSHVRPATEIASFAACSSSFYLPPFSFLLPWLHTRMRGVSPIASVLAHVPTIYLVSETSQLVAHEETSIDFSPSLPLLPVLIVKSRMTNELNSCFIPSMIMVYIQAEGTRVIVASVRKGA